MHRLKVRRNSTHAPRFSLVIPACRRPRALRNCLRGIAEPDCEKVPYEVLVADDGSDMDLQDVVKEFQSEFNLKLLYRARNLGPAATRAIKHSRGHRSPAGIASPARRPDAAVHRKGSGFSPLGGQLGSAL